MAERLNVSTGCRVAKLSHSKSAWLVEAEVLQSGTSLSYETDSILLTPPVPQSLKLLRHSDIDLAIDLSDRLSKIEYECCICVMAVYDTSHELIPSVFEKMEGSVVDLVVDNFSKGVSRTPGAITIHTKSDFSRHNWDRDDADITDLVLAAVEPLLPGQPLETLVHRWRFGRVVRSHPEKFELLKNPGLLAFAGDGFAGNDIEGAIASGKAAAKAVLSELAQYPHSN